MGKSTHTIFISRSIPIKLVLMERYEFHLSVGLLQNSEKYLENNFYQEFPIQLYFLLENCIIFILWDAILARPVIRFPIFKYRYQCYTL